MKGTFKKIISSLLIITMLCSAIPVFAFENDDIVINMNDEAPEKYDIELPGELPQIEITDDDILPIMSDVSRYNTVDIDKGGVYNKKPKIVMPETTTIEIPSNRVELDENWISANEFDDEDLPLIEAITATKLQKAQEKAQSVENAENARSVSTLPVDSSYRIANINSKDSFALQNQTGRTNYIGDNIGEEYIDPMTGNLIVNETDLVLPGVDGHDLELSRYYSLAQAEVYTKTAGISNEPRVIPLTSDTYVVTESIYNTETYQTSTYYYVYSDLSEAESKIEEIETRDTCNGLYIYSAWWDMATDGEYMIYDYFYSSEITSSSYQTIRNNLGAG